MGGERCHGNRSAVALLMQRLLLLHDDRALRHIFVNPHAVLSLTPPLTLSLTFTLYTSAIQLSSTYVAMMILPVSYTHLVYCGKVLYFTLFTAIRSILIFATTIYYFNYNKHLITVRYEFGKKIGLLVKWARHLTLSDHRRP